MSVSSSPSSGSLPGLLASPGAIQMSYLASFFSILQWWNLVPDQTNVFVTAGKGTAFNNCGIADASGTVAADGYSTASITADKNSWSSLHTDRKYNCSQHGRIRCGI